MKNIKKAFTGINPTTLTIFANMLSFVITFGISFFLTPYVTSNVGMEAYGMVGLAQNFTNYVTIITSALNSMASRFIILNLHKGLKDEANYYFNSTFLANLLFSGIIVFLSFVLVPNLDNIINIAPALVTDAKLTFLIVFISFSISLSLSVFSMSYYAHNKLYIGAVMTIICDALRAILLIFTFKYIGVKIQYIVIMTLITGLISNIIAIIFTKKTTPEIFISFKYAKIKYVFRMIKSGIWSSISKLGQILLDGLDLIITNLFIGGDILGIVSVSKTFSGIIISIISSVSDSFFPKMLRAYASGKKELNEEFIASTKTLGYFSFVIISLFASYCEDFYKIWLPDQNSILLRNLTLIGLLSIMISGPIYSIFSVFTIIDKVRAQAISTLVMSVLSTVTVFILLKTTNLGVYAIVGVSTVFGMIKNLTYNVFYIKRHTSLNILKIYTIVIKNAFILLFAVGLFWFIKQYFNLDSYIKLIAFILISFVFVSVIYFFIMLNKEEKNKIFNNITARVKK